MIADSLCEAGRMGQKSGRGWYRYEDGRRHEDPEVTAMIEAARGPTREIAASAIVSRLLAALSREGQKLLAEGIAARSSDIDLVMINGYGFPAHAGGPMFSAEQTR
jgi:3-hydroxyacyl-CoA dehydrogenase